MEIDEMIKTLQAFKEGKKFEVRIKGSKNEWKPLGTPPINFSDYDCQVRPEPTLNELTHLSEQWVKDNGIVVGSKVKINSSSWEEAHGKVGTYESCCGEHILIIIDGQRYGCNINTIEPYKEEWIQFRWEDRELFRDKWIRKHGCESDESKIIDFDIDGVLFVSGHISYEKLFLEAEFVDGTPFGKLKQ